MANGLAWTGDLNDFPIHKKAKWWHSLDSAGDVRVAIILDKKTYLDVTVANTSADIGWAVNHLYRWYQGIEADGLLPYKNRAQKWSVFVMVFRAAFGTAAVIGLFASIMLWKLTDVDTTHWIAWGAWMSFLGWWNTTIFQNKYVQDPNVGVVFRKRTR